MSGISAGFTSPPGSPTKGTNTSHGKSPTRTPPRATAAPIITVANEHDRYLLAAIASSPEVAALKASDNDPRINDLFLLMVVVPIGFFERCDEFIRNISTMRDKIFTKSKLTQSRKAFDKLFQDDFLYKALLGDNGVAGYYFHRGDPANHDVYAPHLAHTLISEKYKEQLTRGTDHTQKCRDKLNSVNDVLNKINTLLQFLGPKPEFKDLNLPLQEFTEYYKLHARCLTIALEFDKARDEPKFDRTLKAEPTEFARIWGTGIAEVPKETPQRPGTDVYMLRSMHDSRKRKASSPMPPPITPVAAATYSSPKRAHLMNSAPGGSAGCGDADVDIYGLFHGSSVPMVTAFQTASTAHRLIDWNELIRTSNEVSPLRASFASGLGLAGAEAETEQESSLATGLTGQPMRKKRLFEI